MTNTGTSGLKGLNAKIKKGVKKLEEGRIENQN